MNDVPKRTVEEEMARLIEALHERAGINDDHDRGPLSCQWCPVCRGIDYLREVSPAAIDSLAELAAAAAAALREISAARSANEAAPDRKTTTIPVQDGPDWTDNDRHDD